MGIKKGELKINSPFLFHLSERNVLEVRYG
jgi:hypothetical protein